LQWGGSGIDTDHHSAWTHATGKLQGQIPSTAAQIKPVLTSDGL